MRVYTHLPNPICGTCAHHRPHYVRCYHVCNLDGIAEQPWRVACDRYHVRTWHPLDRWLVVYHRSPANMGAERGDTECG